MTDEGPKGFEGGMTRKKYIAITKASEATVTRDLQILVELGAFSTEGGGRSTPLYFEYLDSVLHLVLPPFK